MNIVKRILLTLLVVVGGIALYLTVRHYLDQESVTEPGVDPTGLPRLAVVAETRLEPPGPTDVMGFGRAAALSGDRGPQLGWPWLSSIGCGICLRP
jgi:hypothetical protein